MKSFVCYRGVAQPWHCDHLGHFNTQFYMEAFDVASQHLFSQLGYQRREGFGWADVKHEIQYKGEVGLGQLIHVTCEVTRLGNKSITYFQRLVLTDSEVVAAENSATSVLFDLTARAAVPLPEAVRLAVDAG